LRVDELFVADVFATDAGTELPNTVVGFCAADIGAVEGYACGKRRMKHENEGDRNGQNPV